MATPAEVKLANETFFSWLEGGMTKKAADAVNDFTRFKMREDGFWRRVMPPLPITNDDLDRDVSTDKPIKIIDKETDVPAAASIPFADIPFSLWIKPSRYKVGFGRIVTPQLMKDKDELRSYHIDVRQVMSDNMIKEMLTEEDTKAVGAINTVLIGQDVIVPATGVVQWASIPGGLTREGFAEAFKIMPRSTAHLHPNTVLINNVTIYEIMKWGRDEMGGDFSQDLIKNGWSEQQFFNANLLITLKRNLVPDDTIYLFGDPKFIGKSFVLDDATLSMEVKAYLISWFYFECVGSCLANISALARADFV